MPSPFAIGLGNAATYYGPPLLSHLYRPENPARSICINLGAAFAYCGPPLLSHFYRPEHSARNICINLGAALAYDIVRYFLLRPSQALPIPPGEPGYSLQATSSLHLIGLATTHTLVLMGITSLRGPRRWWQWPVAGIMYVVMGSTISSFVPSYNWREYRECDLMMRY